MAEEFPTWDDPDYTWDDARLTWDGKIITPWEKVDDPTEINKSDWEEILN